MELEETQSGQPGEPQAPGHDQDDAPQGPLAPQQDDAQPTADDAEPTTDTPLFDPYIDDAIESDDDLSEFLNALDGVHDDEDVAPQMHIKLDQA